VRHKAKLFLNGRSQAVRLPAEFRFDCQEVFIRQEPKSGDVILSRRPESWDDFLELIHQDPAPSDFMTDREDCAAQERELF
jgi:antitoxin VapB